jgi:valyl-tRNA synthetase
MMMMGLHFMGEVPFRDVVIHGLVRDAKGQKMSKSKGNVLDPLELIDAHGADAVRFTLCALASPGRDVKLDPARLEGYRAFATKLWNAARFCEMNGIAARPGWDPARAEGALARWILDAADRAVAEATAALEAFRFDDYAASVHRFTWATFCDWFLEFAKPALTGPDGAEKDEVRGAAQHVLGVILRLMHPVMPFVTEELWVRLGYGAEASLVTAPWPKAGPAPDAATLAARAEMERLVAVIGEVRAARSELNVPAGAVLPLRSNGDATLARHATLVERLGRVALAGAGQGLTIPVVAAGATYDLVVGDAIDAAAERARLAKERARAEAERAKLVAKLANAGFLAKAEPAVVQETEERAAEEAGRVARLDAALARLGG